MESGLAGAASLLWLMYLVGSPGAAMGYHSDDDVRLVGMSPYNVTLPPDQYPYYGRVEVNFGDWISVCGGNWGLKEANVVCRELGFRRALSPKTNAYYGEGSGSTTIGNVRCRGNEEALLFCAFEYQFESACGHDQDVGVLCDTVDPIDYCVTNEPCLNGGTCLSLDGEDFKDDFLCVCVTGFGGDLCERDAVPCDSSPCLFGNCTNIGDSYHCTCKDGWVSTNCDLDAHPCRKSPCENGGSCIDETENPGHYVCECVGKWGGPTCAYEAGTEIYEPRFVSVFSGVISGVDVLEVWDGTRWRRVCTAHFTEKEATTACKALGYVDFSYGTLTTYTNEDLHQSVGHPSGCYWCDDEEDDAVSHPLDVQFKCSDRATKLSDCGTIPISTDSCGSVEIACEAYSFVTSPYAIILYIVGSVLVFVVIPVAVGLGLRIRRRRRLLVRVASVRVRVDAATEAAESEPTAAQPTDLAPPTGVPYERFQ